MIANWFPASPALQPERLQMTPTGVYSMTRRAEGDELIRILKRTFGSLKDKTILDATGNVGGDTILFGLHFAYVHSVEIDDAHFKVLKNNVDAYGMLRSKVAVHNGDATKMWSRFKVDYIYVDPPWGGPGYKTARSLDLYVGQQRIDQWILDEIATRRGWKPKAVILKLPRNYAFWRFHGTLPGVQSVRRFAIRNFYIVILALQ
jgi:hypothetical protein